TLGRDAGEPPRARAVDRPARLGLHGRTVGGRGVLREQRSGDARFTHDRGRPRGRRGARAGDDRAMRLRIGTRGSALALAQSTDVATRLRAPGHDPELVVISTVGDRVTDRAFTDVGSFGLFVRELESALLEGTIDAAVHSYKDVPSRMPQGLVIAAVPERVDVAD